MCHRLIVLMVMLIFIGGCGGGSNDSTESSININLPPHPGDEGKSSLQGIDSDNDGVRDDVQIAISERYPNNKNKQNTLKQTAQALQKAIVYGNSSDSSMINQTTNLLMSAIECLYEKVDNPLLEIGFLEKEIINTSERNAAYIKFNEAGNGHFLSSENMNNSCQ